MRLKPEIARAVLGLSDGLSVRQLTLRDVEDGLRQILRKDPMKAERAVGALYGGVFKNKEIRYDAAGGRWLEPTWQ